MECGATRALPIRFAALRNTARFSDPPTLPSAPALGTRVVGKALPLADQVPDATKPNAFHVRNTGKNNQSDNGQRGEQEPGILIALVEDGKDDPNPKQDTANDLTKQVQREDGFDNHPFGYEKLDQAPRT